MSWVFESSGAAVRGPLEAGWWSMGLAALGQAAQVALAGAYFAAIASLVWLRKGWRHDLELTGPLRRVAAVLGVFAATHAGVFVVLWMAQQRLATLPPLFAAVLASVATSRLARFARVARGDASPPRAAGLLGDSGPEAGPPPADDPAASEAAPKGQRKAPEERGGWARLKLSKVEDAAQRNAWLRQSGEMIAGLSDLLGGASPSADKGSPGGPRGT